eukprot:CAMPEP_0171062118 /NCGR_PEP_ID=MMETSP0766_2-20121228/4882_1 /TAXON_ID=439317 /ORGANISM="Gambierdiscus australes, Strain CAWD 149" /LENGTH=40 /DNA_ID= /DNA_START= /DNA_END= /DNA_ORIENTATION=
MALAEAHEELVSCASQQSMTDRSSRSSIALANLPPACVFK